MPISRRGLAALLFAPIVFCAAPALAQDTEWPTRPIRLVLGYTPGGAADSSARDLAPLLEKALGQPVVVDYKPGAGGAIGADAVAKAPADGYTIGLVDGGPLTISPHLRHVPYDPLKSFTPIGGVSRAPLVLLVHPAVQANNVAELINLAKRNPQGLSYSSSGPGTIHHLAGELFRSTTQAPMVHVPYKGAGPALNDLMAGQIPVSFATLAPAIPLVASGKVRAIAVTSSARSSAFPDVPSLAEQGVKGYEAIGWFGLLGPAGLPPAIVAKLNAALGKALADARVRERLRSLGSDPMPGSPADLSALISADYAKWGKVIRDGHIRIE